MDLASTASLFDDLVSLIPPQHYFIQPPSETPGRYMHNKGLKAPKQDIKNATKKAQKLKTTVIEEQEKMAETQPVPSPSNHSNSIQSALSGSELHSKLQERIESLKRQKKDQKPLTREAILENRRAKKADRKKALLKRTERKNTLDTIGMKTDVPTVKEIKENVSFGNIDFGHEVSKKRKTVSDPSVLLKQVEAKKAKLEKLKETDAVKAEKIMEKDSWNKLMDKAEGIKIKDNIPMLKKTVKRKEMEKKKSSSVWTDRVDSVKKLEEEKQAKRQENLQKRIQDKKDKRMGKKAPKSKKPAKKPGFK